MCLDIVFSSDAAKQTEWAAHITSITTVGDTQNIKFIIIVQVAHTQTHEIW